MNYSNKSLSVPSLIARQSRSSRLSRALPILVVALSAIGCSEAPLNEESNNEVIAAVASKLKTVEENYLPESIVETGAASSASLKSNAPLSNQVSAQDDDICAGLNIIECQPRLIRAYIKYGNGAVALTHQVVLSVARDLSNAPNNSTGVINVPEKNLRVEYNKRTVLDFDFLISQGSTPVGRVSANADLYTIQFDLGILESDKPGSRGGKIEISVDYKKSSDWTSQVTVSNLLCSPNKPDDPETARISVNRKDGIWKGRSMFYNGIAAAYSAQKSCDTPASDDTGLVTYTDFVADSKAAKAAIYVMKRNETSTTDIQNFGFNLLCTNYPDLCVNLAAALSTTPETVDAFLGQMTNPYCVVRGSPGVTWNSDCRSQSAAVADSPFISDLTGRLAWVSPADFYQLEVSIPTTFATSTSKPAK
jgi:hypothetical protein